MPFRIDSVYEDGKPIRIVRESYDDEIAQAFLEADRDAGEEVDVIYMIDDKTGEDIELWRQDWMIVKVK